VKDLESIRQDLNRLDERMGVAFGLHLESPTIIRSVISGQLASKAIEMVEGVIGTYSLTELVIAAEVCAESQVMRDCLAGEARN
jgi:hypothetical protein